jgi:hypothetical protein
MKWAPDGPRWIEGSGRCGRKSDQETAIGESMMKRVAIILMAVCVVGAGALVRPVRAASGLTYIAPRATLAGQGAVRVWDLGRNAAKGTPAGPLANIVEAEWPGCTGEPCAVTVAVNYYGGPGDTSSLAAPIVQVGQVTPTLFVLLSGSCDSNLCSVHVWAIDARPGHGTTSTVLANDQLSQVVMECGVITSFQGKKFTVQARADAHKSGNVTLRILGGDASCDTKH